MKTIKNLTAIFGMGTLMACSNASAVGSWTEPVPGMPALQQGFTLNADGSASSINMATLKYESWKQKGNLLMLSGSSIGNRQTLAFTDTLTIERLTPDSLILTKGKLVMRYAKGNQAAEGESIPAATLTPAKKVMTVKGELVIGHEVRSFTAEGESTDHWVTDETDLLYQQYDEVTEGIKNGKPVYVELEVVDLGKADDGFAADYESVYQVTKIIKMSAKD